MKNVICSILVCYCSIVLYGQQKLITGSLPQQEYDELFKSFESVKKIEDTLTAKLYANTYINRAKQHQDTIHIAKGYEYLASISPFDEAIHHIDTIISYTEHLDTYEYPGYSYYLKGRCFYVNGKYVETLDYYLKANEHAINKNNVDLLFKVKQGIGSLKGMWGSSEEAELLSEELLALVRKQQDYKTKYKKQYFDGLFNLSDSYLNNRKLDLAESLINEAIKESLKIPDSLEYYDFVKYAGILRYFQKDYTAALDSLDKAIRYKKTPHVVTCFYYKGKVYEDLGKIEQAIFTFKKVDSFIQKTGIVYPDFRDIYETFIDYYKAKNDSKNQLYYIDRLLYTDSIEDRNHRQLAQIYKKYDTPKLISEKERIISTLEQENGLISKRSVIILVLLVLSSIGFGYYFYKQRQYKKRFIQLLNQTTNTEEKNEHILEASKPIGISKEAIAHILHHLTIFEKEQGYLKPILSSDLAKRFDTNARYLSIVVNTYKEKSFTQYINELRIVYAIQRLQSDSIFRKYTIKAIANDIGFNTADAFSKAFYKKTGIYPSYFIKRLAQ